VSLVLAASGFDPIHGLVVFVLGCFVGYEVILRVPTLLHTPLMSGSNAVSGIIVVGAVIMAGLAESTLAVALALVGVFFATINAVGGFVVTDRMLRMFRRKGSGPGGKGP
jgi:NAD(P) transhydrogenase subunit alpha